MGPLAPRIYDAVMHGKRTRAWWWSRLELAVAIGLIVLIVPAAWPLADGPYRAEMYWFVVSIAAMVMALGGLIWMIRIFRGLRDEPPPWRYKGR